MTLSHWRDPRLFERRLADWRVGGVVYQVFVDRFAPSQRLEAKRALYASPRRLRPWDAPPIKGVYLPDEKNMEGELEFWGGDLDSLRSRLDYIQGLGADVVYLNPIFDAFTNHKYDANDFFRVDPQYGTNEDVDALAADLHGRGMRLMLDGVFNHMGRRSPLFLRAQASPEAPERDFFTWGPEFRHGYLSWRNGANLPELRLETPAVREMLWESPGSAVQVWLREHGVDGWRLDVAPDIGFRWLAAIREAAHAARPDAAVIGECWNYPEEWLRVLDGVLNFHAGTLIREWIRGRMDSGVVAQALGRMMEECGLEGILRSHMVLDNHDTARLTSVVPDTAERHLARLLQFTLPGCPVIYYGAELGMGMEGEGDIGARAPMRWDLDTPDNAEGQWMRRLVGLRRENPALRVGECRFLASRRLLAFLRVTASPRETLLVVANSGAEACEETLPVPDSRWMDAAAVECLLTGERAVLRCGLVDVRVGPKSARVYRTVDRGDTPGYSMFKRV